MSLDVLTFTPTYPFLSKILCEKCCLCKYNQDPSHLRLKKGMTLICESSLVAKYFPSLDFQPRWPFLQHFIKFSLSCLDKKKVFLTSREMVRTLLGLLIVTMNKTNTYHPQEEFLIQIIVTTIMNIISFILTEQVMSSIDLWQCQQKQAMV